jgi:hypothetical protein
MRLTSDTYQPVAKYRKNGAPIPHAQDAAEALANYMALSLPGRTPAQVLDEGDRYVVAWADSYQKNARNEVYEVEGIGQLAP